MHVKADLQGEVTVVLLLTPSLQVSATHTGMFVM
jgi:hypothetical protein